MSGITLLSEKKAQYEWNKFVRSLGVVVPFSFHPELFYFYRDKLHWKPYYFLYYRNEELVAVLPLVYTGRACVSLPHFSYGGWLEKKSTGEQEEMLNSLVAMLDKEQWVPGFYRVNEPMPKSEQKELPLFVRGLGPLGTKTHPHKVTSIMELPQNGEEIYALLSPNLRRKIRKVEKNNFNLQSGGMELLDDFYKVYGLRMHQLGSPAYGRSFFKALIQSLGREEGQIFVVYQERHPIGGALLLSYNGFFESAWFATDRKYKQYYISDYLHEKMIRYAIENGGKFYSMGRSTEHGSVYDYKNHWPVQNFPLLLYNTMNFPSVRNQTWMSKLWKYSPRIVAERLGPVLIRHIY